MKAIIKPTNNYRRADASDRDDLREISVMLRFVRMMQAIITFAMWSLRRRTGQFLPIACAFLLLVCATQTIGMLHDIASTQTRQEIAQSWRGPYDLLVRPPSAVSQLERTTSWIDPQSALENYGGISLQQATTLRSLPHVEDVIPFATVGWQSMAVQVPLWLSSSGIYRVSAAWSGQSASRSVDGSDVIAYVEVTDFSHLTIESPLYNSAINSLIVQNSTSPVVFTLSVPALQAIIGMPTAQQSTFAQVLLAGMVPAPTFHLSVRVEKLLKDRTMLSACVRRVDCWQPQSARQGTITYQSVGVQLLRFSQTTYAANAQQLADGQVVVTAIGADMQGPLYRLPLAAHIALPTNFSLPSGTLTPLLPLTAPERLSLLPNDVRFIPLEQACAISGANCYSGLYLRLSGVEHYNQHSLDLLQTTAATIAARTGLHVDILNGSSLRTVRLASATGRRDATIPTAWRVVGVAVQIVHGLDTLQETLLLLCSLVCLLAIGVAGTLVGIGRRKDTVLLQQLGWQAHQLIGILLLDALLLCLPGCLLATIFTLWAMHAWHSSLPPGVVWLLLGIGIVVYCCALVTMAAAEPQKRVRQRRANIEVTQGKVMAPLANALAVVIAIFLIAIEYLMIAGFNQVLVVTVLGNQVRQALEVSQLMLLMLMLVAALLTVALCTTLLVRGRREEVLLLSMVGWERRAVLLRLLWSNCWSALISGELGVLLALGMVSIGGALPSVWVGIVLLGAGPVMGVLLVSLAAIGPAWHETKKVFSWR